ncbi:MAG: response regulator transcription factor [Actinomycetota bacterium]
MSNEPAHSILVVEDDASLSDALRYHLEREGFRIEVAPDGRLALERFRAATPDLVLLDLMIPGIAGLDLCRLIRAESQVPVLILTAKGSESDKVVSLELGADDHMTKPFSMRELTARVRAHLRRAGMAGEPQTSPILTAGPLAIDPDRHIVKVRGEEVAMTPKEFLILELMVERKGRLLTRDFLIDEVWGPEFTGVTTTLDVHIRRLREKIEQDPKVPVHICTVRGLGYKFQE